MPQTNNESEAKIPAKRRKSPRRRWKRVLWLLPVLMTLLILRVERNVTDVVLTLSQATARSLAIQALNEAASEMLGLGVHYADLMTVEKDDQGQVRLIQANTPEMNRLAAQASLCIYISSHFLPLINLQALPVLHLQMMHRLHCCISSQD